MPFGAGLTVRPVASAVILCGGHVIEMGGRGARVNSAQMIDGAQFDGSDPLLIHDAMHLALPAVADAIDHLDQTVSVRVSRSCPDEAGADQGPAKWVQTIGCRGDDETCARTGSQRDKLAHADLPSQVDHAPDGASRCGAFPYLSYPADTPVDGHP